MPVVSLRFAFPGGAALDPQGKRRHRRAGLRDARRRRRPVRYRRLSSKLDDLAGELRFAAGHDEFDGSLRVLKTI